MTPLLISYLRFNPVVKDRIATHTGGIHQNIHLYVITFRIFHLHTSNYRYFQKRYGYQFCVNNFEQISNLVYNGVLFLFDCMIKHIT